MIYDTKPNLFIIGAPKAGTTLLYNRLKDHPDIFFPKQKELNFFTKDELLEKSYYKDFKITSFDSYLNAFKKAAKYKYKVDGSVSYFASYEAIRQINIFNNKAKFIIILRDPIDRAFSHYLMDSRMGHASKPFTDYLSEPDSYNYFQYIHNSLYGKILENLLIFINPEDICILQLENIKDDFNKIFRFLSIEANREDNNLGTKVNPSKLPKNIIGSYFLNNRNVAENIKPLIPTFLINIFNRLLYSQSKKDIKLSAQEREILGTILKDDKEVLCSLLKANFNIALKW